MYARFYDHRSLALSVEPLFDGIKDFGISHGEMFDIRTTQIGQREYLCHQLGYR
jgi:hypothetical protein